MATGVAGIPRSVCYRPRLAPARFAVPIRRTAAAVLLVALPALAAGAHAQAPPSPYPPPPSQWPAPVAPPPPPGQWSPALPYNVPQIPVPGQPPQIPGAPTIPPGTSWPAGSTGAPQTQPPSQPYGQGPEWWERVRQPTTVTPSTPPAQSPGRVPSTSRPPGTAPLSTPTIPRVTDPDWGKPLEEYRGVRAFSRGNCTGNRPGMSPNNVPCEEDLQWQCVDYAKRFYEEAYRHVPQVVSEVVKTQWDTAWAFWLRPNYITLDRFINGKSVEPPQRGDMLFFAESKSRPGGHVAIVTGITGAAVNVIQQNVSRDSALGSVSLTKEARGYVVGSVAGMPAVGWLRPAVAHASQAVTVRVESAETVPGSARVGQAVTLRLRFTNTSTTLHTFIAGASLWRPNGGRQDFERPVTLSPNQTTEVTWSYQVARPGNWSYQFAVWRQKPFVAGNLLTKIPSPVGSFSVSAAAAQPQPQTPDVRLPLLHWPLLGSRASRNVALGYGADWTWTECAGKSKQHTGVDLSAKAGERVLAAADGIIGETFTVSSTHDWGQGIVMDHGSFVTAYLHVVPLKAGGQARAGEEIATIYSMPGPHLHFNVVNRAYLQVAGVAKRGGLPRARGASDYEAGRFTGCKTDPLFPEGPFVDPLNLAYRESATSSPLVAPPPAGPDPRLLAQLEQARTAWQGLNARASQLRYPTDAERVAVSQALQHAGKALDAAEAAARRGDRATVQAELANVQQVLSATSQRLAQIAQRSTPVPQPAPSQPGRPTAAASPAQTVAPRVAVIPASGDRGTFFNQPGEGFTPNSTVSLYFRKPDGSQYAALKKSTDAVGRYSHVWTAPPGAVAGRYQYWATDDRTGKQSNVVTFAVTVASASPVPPPVAAAPPRAVATPAPPPTPPDAPSTLAVANTGGLGLRLRANPTLKASVVATLPEGARITVTGGPVQADGYTWWKLSGPLGTGWGAVGTWLTPAPVVGGTVTVANTGGLGLHLRRDASARAPVVATLGEGASATVVGGPIQRDGYTWWRIRSASGTGWSAIGNWLVP